LQYELGRLIEFGGGGYTMQASQIAQVLVRGCAAGFISQLDPLIGRKEWLLSLRGIQT
jgi:hypothetical protein